MMMQVFSAWDRQAASYLYFAAPLAIATPAPAAGAIGLPAEALLPPLPRGARPIGRGPCAVGTIVQGAVR